MENVSNMFITTKEYLYWANSPVYKITLWLVQAGVISAHKEKLPYDPTSIPSSKQWGVFQK